MQPLTRGPEASDTAASAAHPLYTRLCDAEAAEAYRSAARSTCAAASNVRSSPLGADMECKSGNSSADALFTQGLVALMQPIICCVKAQSLPTRVCDRVLRRCHVAPKRCGSELEL
jgi:hypothetical protein